MRTALVKVFRDIWAYKARSLLILIGILIGTAATGSVLSAYSILNREMNRNFMDTNPASIVVYSGNLNPEAIEAVKTKYPEISVEMRKTVTARIYNDDGTFGIISLRAVEDFNNLTVDKFTIENGSYPGNPDELAIERDSFKINKNIKGIPGEKVQVKMPGGKDSLLTLSGIVHAPGLAPASMEHFSYGFITLDSLQKMGCEGWYDEIRIVSYEDRFDRQKMKELSNSISDTLEENGCGISKINVPVPGKHPHASQLDSILFLLQAFAFVSLLAACLIIINLLNFILAGQSRQIAIMKSVGATSGKIALPYFMFVSLISLLGVILSIPIALVCGAAYSDFAAGILNFKIFNYSVPYWVFQVQILVGILVPVVSAIYPIMKSCGKPVKEGLYEKVASGTLTNKKATGNKTPIHSKSIVNIPAANLGRKKSRTVLAIIALAMGGVLFMTSRNIGASVQKTVDESFNAKKWDYDVRLEGVYDETRLANALSGIKGLSGYEFWEGGVAGFSKEGSSESGSYVVRIMPENGSMNDNVIIVNKLLAGEEPWVKLGAIATLRVGEKTADFSITGIVNEVPGLAPTVYISRNAYAKTFGKGTNQSILISAATRDKALQMDILKSIETGFRDAGIEISESWTLYLLRKAFVDHLYVIITLLGIIAAVAVLVGGMSIASAIGISVSERKREIGIMRATGASRKQTLSMVLLESTLTGVLGWILGIALSIPVSIVIGNYFGGIFLQADLVNIVSINGAIIWLAISVIVSAISGIFPASRASKASLRDMLAYE